MDLDGGVPRVVVVDDATDVRRLVRTRLRLSGRLEVVGEGATGLEAVEAARTHQPDLMLLDVSMPQMDGLEALPQVFEASPHTRVVMYSGFAEQGLADRALELGASAFLEKSTSLRELADQLLAVLGDGAAADGVPASPRTPWSPVLAPPETATDEGADGAAEEAVLREHLERFREVFDVAAIGMATVTLAGQLVRVNTAMATILDRPAEELIGASYADLAGAAAERVEHALADLLSGRSRLAQIEHDVRRGSAEATVVATLAPVLDSEDRPLYFFLQVQDVTAQRGAEEQLRQSEARFRLLVENVEDYAIFMLSTDGTVQSWNAGAERINGYTEDEIVGRHFRTFYPPALQQSRHPEHELEVALREGHYEEEGWRLRKDGSRFWANVLITAVHDRDGRHVGFAKVTRDISERRTMLEEREATAAALAAANARLQQAAEDQAHFLAVTAHELRTPVGVLAGTADTLREHWAQLDAEDREELLDGMRSSGARLRRLFADLLTASRLQNSALDLTTDEVDLADVLSVAADTVRRVHPGAQVEVDAAPGMLVRGDADRLAQAVDNLLGNALRHGVPPVRATTRYAEPADGAPGVDGRDRSIVEVVVTDAGPGVSEHMQDRLFGRFATGRSHGGTGLGLYIVRQLARAHGGEATYRPAPAASSGSGEFVISLPALGKDQP